MVLHKVKDIKEERLYREFFWFDHSPRYEKQKGAF